MKEGFKGERSLVIPKMVTDLLEEDEYCRQLYVTDIGYYPRARHHYRERGEAIDQHVFIYCKEGRGWTETGQTRQELAANSFVILPAGTAHRYGSREDDPWTIYWMHFKGAQSRAMIEGLTTVHRLAPSPTSRISERLALFEEIFTTLKRGYSIENLRYAHSIVHHFLGSLRYVSQFREGGAGGRSHAPASIGEQAVKYMKENIENHLTLAEIAKYVGYTPNHFSTLFRKEIGHAPLSYHNLLKMQEACRLLEGTEMKVNQIASKLGFEDPYYFTRLFTKIMGMSPTSYRNQEIG